MEAETRYPRPSGELVTALVEAALRGAGGRRAAATVLVETGSSSLVLLEGRLAVRIARTPAGSADLRRSQALVDALPVLPFDVPRSMGEPVEIDGIVAMTTMRLEGAPHPAASGDPRALRALPSAVHELDPRPLSPHLAEPRRFMGGDRWQAVLRDEVVPLLDESVRGAAMRRIDALAALPPRPPAVNHGDLAGANVLWQDGRVVGVLDWDLAAVEDPAEDVASLLSWHGWDLISAVVDGATAARATVFRDTFPLQVVAFTLLQRRPAEEISRAVERAERRLSDSPSAGH